MKCVVAPKEPTPEPTPGEIAANAAYERAAVLAKEWRESLDPLDDSPPVFVLAIYCHVSHTAPTQVFDAVWNQVDTPEKLVAFLQSKGCHHTAHGKILGHDWGTLVTLNPTRF